MVDSKNSRAYLWSGTAYGIRINLKGRDPYGIVGPHDYESLRNELIAKLKQLKDPISNKRLFYMVLKKEDAIGDVPAQESLTSSDIYMLPTNMDYGLISFDKKNRMYRRKKGGFHRKEGVFFALGDEFNSRLNAGKLSIVDVSPTILHAMGIEVPNDVDGKVRKEVFKKNSDSYKRKVILGPSSQKKAQEQRLSKKEESKIKNHLAALGYME